MQFKLVALLTLAIASVNAAALDKRSGERCVHHLDWPISNAVFSGTCTCGNNQYSGPATQAAIDQAKAGTFDGYLTYHATFRGL